MLRVYVAADCPASTLAVDLVERVRKQCPDVPLQIIDISAPDARVPDEIFATPIYTWNDRVVFLGNPSETTLLEQVRIFDGQGKGH
jgi:hypothetical protein